MEKALYDDAATMKRANLRKTIALIPAYNEREKIEQVLSLCEASLDILVIVNDGSDDGSKEILDAWGRGRPCAHVIHGEKNRGMSWAVKEGLRFIQRARQELEIGDEDIIVQVDADAQHSLEGLPALLEHMDKDQVDCLITRRRLDGYPPLKIIGNHVMSFIGSVLARKRFYDIESGYRMIRVRAVPALLFYMVGYKYSWAQEMAVISSWLGHKIDNDQEVRINYYRKRGTRMVDALINCFFSSIILPLKWCFKALTLKAFSLRRKGTCALPISGKSEWGRD